MMWEKCRQRCKAEFSSAKYHHHPFTAGYQRTWQAVTLPCLLSLQQQWAALWHILCLSNTQHCRHWEEECRLTEGTVRQQRESALLLSPWTLFPSSSIRVATREKPLPPIFCLNTGFHRNHQLFNKRAVKKTKERIDRLDYASLLRLLPKVITTAWHSMG